MERSDKRRDQTHGQIGQMEKSGKWKDRENGIDLTNGKIRHIERSDNGEI